MATKKRKKKRRMANAREMDAVLEILDHATPFEIRVADFLVRRCKRSGITVADLKDIIWNEQDLNLISRMSFEMAEQNPKTKFEDLLKILNDAWNHFPHKRLNGLAPRDMMQRAASDKDFVAEERPDFYRLFADRFPPNVRVKIQRDHDWSWEFPSAYHSTRTALAAIREGQEESSVENDNVSEIEEIERQLLQKIDIAFAKMSLDEEPLQFEAAIVLARDASAGGEERLALNILETAIFEGRKLIPAEFRLGVDVLPWAFVDNRAFLLILGEYGTAVEAIDGPQKAIPHYEELLALNPNDNQGMREILATAYLKTNRLENLLQLDQRYPDDMMPGVKVGALLALYKLGRIDEARQRMPQMLKRFPKIIAEVLKIEHPKPELTQGKVQVGGDDEAWLYWQNQGDFWIAAPGAREFLRNNIEQPMRPE